MRAEPTPISFAEALGGRIFCSAPFWSRWQDLNLRPLDPKSRALPNWATSRYYISKYSQLYSLQVPMVGIDNILKHCWGDGHYHALIPRSNPLFHRFSSARTNYFLWWVVPDSNQECLTTTDLQSAAIPIPLNDPYVKYIWKDVIFQFDEHILDPRSVFSKFSVSLYNFGNLLQNKKIGHILLKNVINQDFSESYNVVALIRGAQPLGCEGRTQTFL